MRRKRNNVKKRKAVQFFFVASTHGAWTNDKLNINIELSSKYHLYISTLHRHLSQKKMNEIQVKEISRILLCFDLNKASVRSLITCSL